MTKLYLSYMSQTHTGSDSYDNGEWDCYHSEYGTAYYTGISLTPGFKDIIETDEDYVEGDIVSLCYVVYSTGNTFGHSEGHLQALAVSKDAKELDVIQTWAYEVDDLARKREYVSYDLKTHKNVKTKWPKNIKPIDYPEFVGYFEALQCARIEQFIVEP